MTLLKRVEILEVPEKFYFKVSAAATYLGVSANTLRKYTDLGLIKARRLPSGDRSYSKDSLDNFWDGLPDALATVRESSYTPLQSDLSLVPRKEDQWE